LRELVIEENDVFLSFNCPNMTDESFEDLNEMLTLHMPCKPSLSKYQSAQCPSGKVSIQLYTQEVHYSAGRGFTNES
jgi:hypothetical protein